MPPPIISDKTKLLLPIGVIATLLGTFGFGGWKASEWNRDMREAIASSKEDTKTLILSIRNENQTVIQAMRHENQLSIAELRATIEQLNVRLEAGVKDRFTKGDMSEWALRAQMKNPTIAIPDPRSPGQLLKDQ